MSDKSNWEPMGGGGRVYMMGNQGSLFIFQVAKCSDLPTLPVGSTCPAPSASGTGTPAASPSG
jgi:hypothetical protein